jgi:chromate transporter
VTSTTAVSFGEATRVWWRISLQTFGGPAGQIAVMHRELVDQRRWISHRRFLHALSYCTLLPGPEAQQLATYLGWLLHGTGGALVAGTLFVIPGFMAMLAVSLVYAGAGDTAVLTAVFAGVAPAVVPVVVQAVARFANRLRDPATPAGHSWQLALAVAAGASLTLFAVPFPIVVGAAFAVGVVAPRRGGTGAACVDDDEAHDHLHREVPSVGRFARIVVFGLVVWVVPVAVVGVLSDGGAFVEQGQFFGGMALVTFGGAYAVLTFVARRAVDVYGWVTPTDMARGLALAESTPGPLIMVVQFVGFLGAYRDPGSFDPWVAGVIASVLVTWVTFVPSFLFILLGAPHVEALRANRWLSAGMRGVTAAVVGVIANLALYLAVHTLFDDVRRHRAGLLDLEAPVWGSLDLAAVAVAALAAALLFWRRWSIPRVLLVCAAVGAALDLAR